MSNIDSVDAVIEWFFLMLDKDVIADFVNI